MSSTTIADPRYRGKWGVVSPSTGPTMSAIEPRTSRKNRAAPIAAPRPSQTRAATSETPAASMTSIGAKTKRNCGTPKSNSAWKVERPSRNAPVRATLRTQRTQPMPSRSRPALSLARLPSTSRTASPMSVIEAPPISIRCVGPQRVTSWPKRRCQTSSSGKPVSEKAPQAAIRMPPMGAYQSPEMRIGGGAGALLRHHDGEEAGREDAEEAGEDEVVRGVRERALVAALVDVDRDVPEHPEERCEQRPGDDGGGEGGPAGDPGLAFGECPEAVEQVGAPGPVPVAEGEEGAGDDHRRGGRDHDLADRGAAGRWAGLGEKGDEVGHWGSWVEGVHARNGQG